MPPRPHHPRLAAASRGRAGKALLALRRTLDGPPGGPALLPQARRPGAAEGRGVSGRVATRAGPAAQGRHSRRSLEEPLGPEHQAPAGPRLLRLGARQAPAGPGRARPARASRGRGHEKIRTQKHPSRGWTCSSCTASHRRDLLGGLDVVVDHGRACQPLLRPLDPHRHPAAAPPPPRRVSQRLGPRGHAGGMPREPHATRATRPACRRRGRLPRRAVTLPRCANRPAAPV